jgi:hypothetical protein
MLRFYMTPETRQALIAESNRLIAERASRQERSTFASWAETAPATLGPDRGDDADAYASPSESAFARLVSELQSLPR